ncbi:molybdate ABC transporter substrate-binding protein [endosymbiont of Lamellibrachia barhami]|uniref:molybdate ABC transporter substrate-binding protein n=1 Tax=endosymbiont of Lamellibrachia barhami TaxID=205975 RepID=UPI0015A83D4F|nr:molybdate ABC transporter substrate-binding protein [endosymbiont of Lamellibrachia barhami]
MNIPRSTIRLLLLILALSLSSIGAQAAEIRVAVASNFSGTIKEIAQRFEAQSGHKVTLSVSSTGKHYAQIRNGAPFDLFFAADTRRPKLLDESGLIISGSRFTYAVGRVVLWSPKAGYVDRQGLVLEQGDFRFLAVANPKLAPYGRAAKEVLQLRGLWKKLRGRMVRGESIGQAFQFVKSGNAELGFVAYSQIKQPHSEPAGSLWEVPRSLYRPIEQQVVLLRDRPAARALLAFVKGDEAVAIIRGYGYGTEGDG